MKCLPYKYNFLYQEEQNKVVGKLCMDTCVWVLENNTTQFFGIFIALGSYFIRSLFFGGGVRVGEFMLI